MQNLSIINLISLLLITKEHTKMGHNCLFHVVAFGKYKTRNSYQAWTKRPGNNPKTHIQVQITKWSKMANNRFDNMQRWFYQILMQTVTQIFIYLCSFFLFEATCISESIFKEVTIILFIYLRTFGLHGGSYRYFISTHLLVQPLLVRCFDIKQIRWYVS